MEQYKTKNKVFNSILQPFVAHLENSNFNIPPETFETLVSTVQEIHENIKKDSCTDINVPAFKIFLELDHEIRLNHNKIQTPIEWRKYITALYNTLSEFDDYNIKNINSLLEKLQEKLDSLTSSLNTAYLKTWFQEFCEQLNQLFQLLNKRTSETISQTSFKDILLYVIQLSTCLKVLFLIFSEEIRNNVIIIESRRFIKKRFIFIFDIKKNLIIESVDLNPGFIQWMDNALDLLANLDPNTTTIKSTDSLKSAVDEVLCHGMSIAQICSSEDCKKIKASVQSVLHEFNQLEIEYKKIVLNPSMCNLSLDLVSDKLCLLEKRVNTAVLNISLNVFSTPFEPLKKLQNFCEDNNRSILSRSEDDLDELITNFDSHVDCMIQVGLFAIACSTNIKIVSKIRSYLASLENLECEIIPALTSLYMEPSQISCMHVNILANHWLDEIKNLRKDVCFIIDPVAFGQVLQEEYKLQIENLEQILESDSILPKDRIDVMCNNIKVFILVVEASIEDLQIKKDSDILTQLEKLKLVYNEVCYAKELLIKNDRKFSERVLKRIFILSTYINRLIKCFIGENKNNSKTVLNENTKSNIEEKNTTAIRNISLNKLENRALEILKDRSVLYKTPNKTAKLVPFVTPKTIMQSESRKLGFSYVRKQNIPTFDISESDESLDLQITAILEEITNLMDTLNT